MTDREKVTPWLTDLSSAFTASGLGAMPGFDLYVFVAQGFRESGFGWAPGYAPRGDPKGTGDAGHGHGFYQVDDRTYGDWIKTAHWWEPRVHFDKALSITRGDKMYFKSLSHMPGVPDDVFLRIVLAAYNCGPSNARKGFIHHDNPDHFTAHGDYSAWILNKARDLRVQMPELTNGISS